MSSYSNSKDVRLDEIESNVNPSSEAVLAIIQELEENGSTINLTEESRKSFKAFEKSLEYRRLRKIFMLKLGQYSAGELTLQAVRQSNQDFKAKENARRQLAGNPHLYKIQENKDTSIEGRTSLFSCQKNRYITVQFQSQIKDDLFQSSVVEYSFKNQRMTLLIQSFFNFLETAKDLGIPRSKLGFVFNIFCKMCLPSLQGQMNPDPSCLAGNLDKLLEHISIKAERKKLENHLNQIIRSPGESLEGYTHLLFTLFNSFCTLDFIVDTKEHEEGFEDIVNNPSQISKYKIVDDKVQELLRKSLRSLCSPEAQRNVTDLIRKKKLPMPSEAMKECIFKCDDRFPLMHTTKLPSSLVYVSSNDNMDFNPPLEVIQGQFGYFGAQRQRPPSPGQRPASPGQGQYQRPQSPRLQRQSSPGQQRSPRSYQRQQPGGYQNPGGYYQTPRYQQSSYPPPQSGYGTYGRPPSPNQQASSSQYQKPGGYQSPRRQSPSYQRRQSPSYQTPSYQRQRSGNTPPPPRDYKQTGTIPPPPRPYYKSPTPPSSSQTQPQRSPGPSPRGSPGRSTLPRPSSRSPSAGRTPSPSNWRDPLSYYLDNISLDKLKYKRLNFCIKCGDKSHTFDKCTIYKGPIKNRCRLCQMYHSTHLCKNTFQQKTRPIFDKAKN